MLLHRSGKLCTCRDRHGDMTKPLNLIGQQFGRLTVLARNASNTRRGNSQWDCQCSCGKLVTVTGNNLVSGNSYSCGCFKRTYASLINTRHGHSRVDKRSREYRSWATMHTRCFNSRTPHYEHYGGQGITVCVRWWSFDNFLADMGPRPPGTTLDRYPDPAGNYEPTNCRWATPTQQYENSRRSRDALGRWRKP